MLFKILFLVSVFYTNSLFSAEIGDFKVKDLNFQNTSYLKLAGKKLTLVDFWATWCKPCLKAIPKLNTLYDTYKSKGVEIIGVNVDSPRNSAKVKPFTHAYNIKYPVVRDPNSKISRSLNILAYPTLLIVDSNMNIVFRHIGFKIGDQKIIEEKIQELLLNEE